MIKARLFFGLLTTTYLSFGQIHLQSDTLENKDTLKTVVRTLCSDSLSSTFFISIPAEVKRHYHAFHTENVLIIEGEGFMTLGETSFFVKKGDLIVIPKGTPHSVKNSGLKPLKVISVQAPYFDGTDRVKIDN
jgi:mannose-6-phosphate isomerase-like protein (cupin superfamily)